MKNRKTMIAIISIVALVLVLIGVTYAYWLVTRTQTNPNVVSSACLDISISNEANDITLTNQFPISDEDGMALTPYTFIVTNNCNTSVDYQVALESLGTESDAISTSALKIAFDDNIALLSDKANIETTISGAYAANRLGYGTLSATGTEGSSASHSLRIWIDEDAPISEANKTFQSKISVTIGQGIENHTKETLAYNILANYNGANAISEIDETENEERIPGIIDMYTTSYASYYYGTEYVLDESTGKYTLSGTLVLATTAECRNGTKACGKYTLHSWNPNHSARSLYEVTDFQTSGDYVTAKMYKYTNVFGVATTENEAGLYKAIDDLGESYYFRGAVTDNYVQFGSYSTNGPVIGYYSATSSTYKEYETFEECNTASSYNTNCQYLYKANDLMYWRIVRINGDGTIRLVYDGTTKNANGVAHTATVGLTAYNTSFEGAEYVGYTYDTSATDTTQVNSTIKATLDTWYDAHLKSNYGIYIADEIFCNDRASRTVYYDEEGEETTQDNAFESYIYYGAYLRLTENKTPRITCTNKSDRYTVSETIGNGYLSNPVGLLTADEAFFAGGTEYPGTNTSYYLYSGDAFWTSSPYYLYSHENIAMVWRVNGDGHVESYDADDNKGARPVINLKADVEFTGTGTIDDPYVIATN